MNIAAYTIMSILLLIIIIFAIAKKAKKSRLQTICKKIAKILLWGIISISDKDRDALIG